MFWPIKQILIDELKSNGVLSVSSKWKEIYPHIKDEPRYVNMLGQPGSTPMDFYRDIVAEMDENLYHDRRSVADMLKVCSSTGGVADASHGSPLF
jgi:pre-mRNA-processing factor 40